MDLRAKQRLTGAIILVALFVLLVPYILTGPRGADVAGTPAEEGMRRYTIDLSAANSAAPASEQPATQPAVALPAPAPAPAPAPVSEQPQLAKPGEQAAPAAVEPPPAVAPPPPATTSAPVAQQVPVEQPAPRVEAQKPAAAAPVARGSFAVQLGSFGSRDNADRLVRDMTAKGFAAFVAPIKSGGRELYRVRVGPTRDREQAEALAAQLRRIGQPGAIVPIS
ncbi:MAG TPA: SPOR domain-containing protein [Steroidobacteraceae bacterium]|nr:SPOR domain-containing protein [Steroidobacteraceae bacterium]